MIRALLTAAFVLAGLVSADAATLTLPNITITNPPVPSTGITCNQTTPLPFAPVAPATVIFTCTVAPENWSGTVSLSGGNSLVLSSSNTLNFNVVVGSTALAAGTYAPGTITATP